MVFKPNYNQQRAERRRAQQAKQEKKLKEQQDAVAARRAGRTAQTPGDNSEPTDSGETETRRGD